MKQFALLLLAALPLAAAEYRIGHASTADTTVDLIERGPQEKLSLIRSSRALTRVITDVCSARLIADFGLERSQILFLGNRPESEPVNAEFPNTAVGLLSAAEKDLHPATDAELLRALQVPSATRLSGHIRSAFQVVDKGYTSPDPLADPKRQRELFPVQAIAFGGSLRMVAVGGVVPADLEHAIRAEWPGKLLIVKAYATDSFATAPENLMQSVRAIKRRIQ